jgi:CubicO group peptidase (beta-lactamase class C family)
MQLAEQGLLDLHADIRSYLPEGFLAKTIYQEPITMIHLMNHNAGFQDVVLELFVNSDKKIRPLAQALKLFQPPQIYRPGEVTAYSNYGAALAGYIIELQSGKPFYQYVEDNIFTPLGMTHTAIKPDLSDNEWVRLQREKTQCYYGKRNIGNARAIISFYPAGNATGTITDLRIFAQSLLGDEFGGSPLFQLNQTLELMHTPTFFQPDGVTARFIHGFIGSPHLAGNVMGHGGNTIGMSAVLLNDIENNFGAVVMTNQGNETVYTFKMMSYIFGENDFSKFDNSINNVQLSGIYRNARSIKKGIFNIYEIAGALPVWEKPGGIHIPLLGDIPAVAPGIYKLSSNAIIPESLIFAAADKNGKAQSLSILVMDYIKAKPAAIIFEYLLLLLFIISAMYSLVSLIIMFIKKLRRKEQTIPALRSCFYIASIISLLNFVIFIGRALIFQATYTSTVIHGILFIVICLAIIFFLVMAAFKVRRGFLTAKQKCALIIPYFTGVLILANVIYWQLWMF